jgi:hypothetical protein
MSGESGRTDFKTEAVICIFHCEQPISIGLDGRPSFGYAEGVTEISPVVADAIGLRRENVPQKKSPSPRRTRRWPG